MRLQITKKSKITKVKRIDDSNLLETKDLIFVIPVDVYGNIDKRFGYVLKKHKNLKRIAKLFYGKNKPLLKKSKSKFKTLKREGRIRPVKIRMVIDKRDKSMYRYILLIPTHIPESNSLKVLVNNMEYLKNNAQDMVLTSVTFPSFKNGKELKTKAEEIFNSYVESFKIPTIHIMEKDNGKS